MSLFFRLADSELSFVVNRLYLVHTGRVDLGVNFFAPSWIALAGCGHILVYLVNLAKIMISTANCQVNIRSNEAISH